MTTLTEVQFIRNSMGDAEYAIMPIKLFNALAKDKSIDSASIPHSVVGKTAVEGLTPVRAWREYLNLTQTEVADRMGITQAAFSQMENAKKLSRATKIKISRALNIELKQLDI